MKKVLLLGFALGLLTPVIEAPASSLTAKTSVSASGESIFKKRRRYKANRKGGFLGLFRKKNGCGCPNN
ncbi:MAG: hypothetical protein LH606_12445 [Cytophagaceae bacterium]|nr:hypothetical protein [Cytophagaceae bacterium]